jgi:hypothetical protein
MTARRSATDTGIPLCLIPQVVMREVRTHGEELERAIVRKRGNHFYKISIRTRPIKGELRKVETTARSRLPDGSKEGGEEV